MRKLTTEAVAAALRGVHESEAWFTLLQSIRSRLAERGGAYRLDSDAWNRAAADVWGVVMDRWRNLLMWAITEKEGEAYREIRRAAYERFLSKSKSVMHYLDPHGRIPPRWNLAEEDALRAELRRAFGVSEEE